MLYCCPLSSTRFLSAPLLRCCVYRHTLASVAAVRRCGGDDEAAPAAATAVLRVVSIVVVLVLCQAGKQTQIPAAAAQCAQSAVCPSALEDAVFQTRQVRRAAASLLLGLCPPSSRSLLLSASFTLLAMTSRVPPLKLLLLRDSGVGKVRLRALQVAEARAEAMLRVVLCCCPLLSAVPDVAHDVLR
jgi:hypothetical protein